MKRKYFIISILCTIMIFTGCSGVSSKQKNIYTNNEQIAEEADTHTYFTRTGSRDSAEKINQIELEFSKFYGTDTLWNIKSSGQHGLEISYNSQITNGKFKAVLITEKEEVLILFEGTDKENIVMDIKPGRYRLKIVGQDAKGKIKITIEENANIELKKMD